MQSISRRNVAGSQRARMAGARLVGAVDPAEKVDVTVVVRRRNEVSSSGPARGERLSRSDFANAHGADPEALDRVVAFAHSEGLTVLEADARRRVVRITGSADVVQRAFDVRLRYYRSHGATYRGRTGAVRLPSDVARSVEAVFGMDNRRASRPHVRYHAQAGAGVALEPGQVGRAYNFPPGDGTGETIALLEFGGGFQQADLDTYFQSLGVESPNIEIVELLGAQNDPGIDDDADREVTLDIAVLGAIAPAATLIVYFAPNTEAGFVEAIGRAVHDTEKAPSIVTLSWGDAEVTWTSQAMKSIDALLADAANLGVTVIVASGDGGSTDGQPDGQDHVDFPASSSFALACGGTHLELRKGSILHETAWNELPSGGASGGGFSQVFAAPTYQHGVQPGQCEGFLTSQPAPILEAATASS